MTLEHDAELTTYFEEWKLRFQAESDPNGSTLSTASRSQCLRLHRFWVSIPLYIAPVVSINVFLFDFRLAECHVAL